MVLCIMWPIKWLLVDAQTALPLTWINYRGDGGRKREFRRIAVVVDKFDRAINSLKRTLTQSFEIYTPAKYHNEFLFLSF